MIRKGMLKVLAKTGGIKLDNDDAWINPTPEAKANITERLEEARKLIGKLINLTINENGLWVSMQPAEEQPEPEQQKPVKVNYQQQERVRSMALSYAKDLVTASKIEVNQLIDHAEKMRKYIMGE